MTLKTVTWNIGGGKIAGPEQNSTSSLCYTEDGLGDISEWIRAADPDIVALQEVHGTTPQSNQIVSIADRLGYECWFFDPTSDSHIEAGQQLGNGVISRFPISEHQTGTFHNPRISFPLEGGGVVASHDKSYSTCLIDVNGSRIRTTSLHLLPFGMMNINLDSDAAHTIFASVAAALPTDSDLILIQGDFNINEQTVGRYFPALFTGSGLSELPLQDSTTPKGRKYDHVLYKGLTLTAHRIDSSVETDHYPVLCEFEITK